MWRVTGTFFLSPLTRYFRPYTFVLTTISGVQSSSFINSFTQAQIPFLTITERFKCRWLVESYYKPWKWRDDAATAILGSLSYGIFERGTSTGSRSTGSEVFFILKHLDDPKSHNVPLCWRPSLNNVSPVWVLLSVSFSFSFFLLTPLSHSRLSKAPCKRTQHCWRYMLRPFSHAVVCCWMLIVACCCSKFETGQTFKPTTPNISFVP